MFNFSQKYTLHSLQIHVCNSTFLSDDGRIARDLNNIIILNHAVFLPCRCSSGWSTNSSRCF